MSRFFVGQRVRKVRGLCNVGLTGTVHDLVFVPKGGSYIAGKWCSGEADIQIMYDAEWMNASGCRMEAGQVCCAESVYFEPILDLHEPCESEFKESLDKLLEGMPA